ncbi:MAG: FAD-dependent oxidoreductase, partial [bacterium]
VVPDEVPLYAHARVVASSYGGAVNGVRGGGQSLVNAFSRQLAQLGVTIHCGVGVTGIKFSAAGTVAGVQTDNGADVECRACVSTVHPRYLADLVPEALFRPAYRARLKTSQETLSALILYAACDTTPEALRGRNLVVVSDLEHVASRHEAAFEEQPLFLAGASPNADGKPNPGGFLAICPMAYADLAGWSDSTTGKRPAGYTDYKARLTDRLWHRITAVCPAITAHLTHLEAATPLTLRDYVHTPLGSLYGVKYMTGDHLLGPRTRAAGLYLAGQSILAPGIAGAIVSSFLTCGTIIGHERMLKELQAWH